MCLLTNLLRYMFSDICTLCSITIHTALLSGGGTIPYHTHSIRFELLRVLHRQCYLPGSGVAYHAHSITFGLPSGFGNEEDLEAIPIVNRFNKLLQYSSTIHYSTSLAVSPTMHTALHSGCDQGLKKRRRTWKRAL